MRFAYFANPMCSWCWGFSPVVEKLQKIYSTGKIRLVLAPFRVDTTQPMDQTLRNYVLGQWEKVHQTTSQSFDFRFNMPKDFIYNTTLVCKSIKAFRTQLFSQEQEFFRTLQHAFYTENQNLTDEKILLEIAKKFGLNIRKFSQAIHSDKVAAELEQDFALCQQLAIHSYPSLMIEKNGVYTNLARGYLPYEQLMAQLEILQTS